MMTEPQRILALSQYEGTKPKLVKGIYSKKHSYYKCGNCGATLKHDIVENYCFNCGYRVLWDNPRCLTGHSNKKRQYKKI